MSTLLPGKRLELLFMLLLTLAFSGLIYGNRESEGVDTLAVTFFELFLPFIPAIVAAGLLAGDPALALLLSVSQPAGLTLLKRLLAVLAVTTLLALAVHALLYALETPLPRRGIEWALIWLAPVLLFTGLASFAATLRGRALEGIGVALALWASSLFSLPYLEVVCRGENPCGQALLFPLLTLLKPYDEGWLLNRLLLSGLGILLILFSLVLTRAEERLLRATRTP